ncbi:MAG: ceramidase domain-containing protein [Chitinophagales bacterium]
MKTNLFKISVIYAIVIHVLVFLGIYFAWFGSMEGAGAEFCEAAREGYIKQPANTYSNLMFAFMGLWAAHLFDKGVFKAKNTLTTYKSISLFFILMMISLSAGSFAMHATESAIGGYFDMLSMYLVASFILTYALGRLFSLRAIYYALIYAVLLIICHFFNASTHQFPIVGFGGNFIFMVLINLGIVFEKINDFKHKTKKKSKYGYASVITLAVSFGIWHIGFDHHPWCRPFSFLQAHALWHILDAVALYLLYRYYVSEEAEIRE